MCNRNIHLIVPLKVITLRHFFGMLTQYSNQVEGFSIIRNRSEANNKKMGHCLIDENIRQYFCLIVGIVAFVFIVIFSYQPSFLVLYSNHAH